jgi:hypothetical protein
MEYFIALILGVGLSSAFWIGVIRRSVKKPEGNTAKLVKMIGGGT